MQRPRIFVLGSFVVACTVKVDRLPMAGESLRGLDFNLEAGGKGFNGAVAARRLGAEVDGLLAVGDDLFAPLAAAAVADADLPPQIVVRVAGATGAGVGFVGPDGQNCIAVHPAANDRLSAAHVAGAASRIADAQLVLAQFEIGDAPIAAGFAMARRAGAVTILNPSPWRPIAPELASNTDVIVVNELEAAELARGSAAGAGLVDWRTAFAPIYDLGVGTVVVTRGAHGAACFRRGCEPLEQAAFQVAALDAVGAGDAFLAGLAMALGAGRSWQESLRLACACGALATTQFGLLSALPNQAILQDFLASAPKS